MMEENLRGFKIIGIGEGGWHFITLLYSAKIDSLGPPVVLPPGYTPGGLCIVSENWCANFK